ncbi:hypothetical protein jhhlp_002113 [Lomentospora prolificans]|uniref:Rhodopsin domain-containing protein n=1 Tax=Lomentospora prolificans TaxID=41688 RepID=A0A2N3NDB7_9PEZI|nr:hypothetical protein jhhlp_002113 [Lomentospora prolificans]
MEVDPVVYAKDQQRQDGLVITAAVFTSISFVVVFLRSITRFILIRKAGWDDYLMLVAMVLSIGYFAEVLVGKANHIGHAITTLTVDNMLNLIKVTLGIQLTYYGAISAIKISILCMYLRFLASQKSRMLAYGTIGFHVVFFIICIAVTASQCRPIHKMWDLDGSVEGTCVNTTAFFYFTSGFNIITDIWILALPIKALVKINRPQKEKIALILIFGVGTFATITSIIRLHTIYTYTLAADPFQQSILVNLWSVLEVNIAIICASAPALKPLFTPKALKAARESSNGSNSHKYSIGRSGYIRSKKSVDQTWTETSVTLGPVPYNSTEISAGGRREKEKDNDSTVDILPA